MGPTKSFAFAANCFELCYKWLKIGHCENRVMPLKKAVKQATFCGHFINESINHDHTNTHTCTNKHTHAHTHTHALSYIHTHTHMNNV